MNVLVEFVVNTRGGEDDDKITMRHQAEVHRAWHTSALITHFVSRVLLSLVRREISLLSLSPEPRFQGFTTIPWQKLRCGSTNIGHA